MSAAEITMRNPLLVLLWTFGLFLFMHFHQYISALWVARRAGLTFDAVMKGKAESPTTLLIQGAAALLFGVPLAWVAATVLWRRPMAWMGLTFDGTWLLAGIGLGIALPLLVVFILKLSGQASISRPHRTLGRRERTTTLAAIACMALFTGFAEEIVFRAMAARELSVAMGWPLAVLVSGAYFGFVHLIGQIKTLTASKAATILVASVAVSFMFVAMYVRSGSLWLPIGFHAAWNFSLVGVLGLPMSGRRTEGGLLQTTLTGRPWLTGGEVGVEASVVALAAYALVGLLFVLL
ncbi:MAG: CPBP family intramembrane metalloprotease [Candidatus Atribacteria bacterium]|nr:MAG: CPBP family intramembrane metalloprotease [Candidatus Atribacteria bacterium]